ncbi:hypothetical protein [Leptospira bandrabouensis]|uniref:Uncharacterized protein n=1 Tax=Leptospira bandrabouensis TaxID=2484903 RepID=A0A6H3NXT7_9LEPT|nr:hypothetical protein [Leptospira bandrabouensis]MCG6144136.1 hypothetical protein [Leptospira bandrabouensis]MCG6150855.1 hypothetical protein [Leptospira bandrabouensis]MCG6159797.1 hypothetical protein [Leptospira bandrabouensis]MCG6163730.1 hypothetical protein [Leptospira bandrabouensis]MCW7457162.1 hypothetical protein [Leptospira bandrabouensis]
MKPFKRFRFLLLHIGFLIFLSTGLNNSLFAGETVEVLGGPEDVNLRLVALLNKLDPDFYADEKTQGFVYRYRHRWKNPYDFNIYVGKVGKTSPDSIIRIESPRRGQERMWKQILEQEILQKSPHESAVPLSEKYHIVSQGLNLITPMASVGYNSWNSPLFTNRDTFVSMSIYLLCDLILAGGAYLYAQENLPKKNIWDNMANVKGPGSVWESPNAVGIFAALAVSRAVRAFDAWEDTSAHNKTAQFGWSFKF